MERGWEMTCLNCGETFRTGVSAQLRCSECTFGEKTKERRIGMTLITIHLNDQTQHLLCQNGKANSLCHLDATVLMAEHPARRKSLLKKLGVL